MTLEYLLLAMGRRKDLPYALAKLDEKSESAPAATWATFFVMSAIALMGEIQSAWTLSAFTVLTYYGITNLAALNTAQYIMPVTLRETLLCLSLLRFSFTVSNDR